MLKNIKCLTSILFISILGNNCNSMEEFTNNNPAPQPISKLEQENIQLKNEVKQLSEQVQQLLKQINSMNQIDENNKMYLELKSIHKNFDSKIFQHNSHLSNSDPNPSNFDVGYGITSQYHKNIYDKILKVQNNIKYCFCFVSQDNNPKYFYCPNKRCGIKCNGYCIFDSIYNYEKEYQKEINKNINNIKTSKQFLELSLPNILDNDTKNKVQSMINRYDNVLTKMNEYRNFVNSDTEKLYSKLQNIKYHNNCINQEIDELYKQYKNYRSTSSNSNKMQLLGSEIDLECETNYKLWHGSDSITGLCNSGIFKNIKKDI